MMCKIATRAGPVLAKQKAPGVPEATGEHNGRLETYVSPGGRCVAQIPLAQMSVYNFGFPQPSTINACPGWR